MKLNLDAPRCWHDWKYGAELFGLGNGHDEERYCRGCGRFDYKDDGEKEWKTSETEKDFREVKDGNA